MIVLEVIITMLAVVALATIVNAFEDHAKHENKISFKEAMDLAELPVVTFYQGTEKFNFLLDTGSNHSHISADAAQRIVGTPMTGSENINGVCGAITVDKAIKANLEYKATTYEVILLIGEHLNETFSTIKESTGVQIHGIIGSNFLNDNRYVLDFDELVAYSKA